MKQLLLACIFLGAVQLNAEVENISLEQFTGEHLGQYKILNAGGHIPKSDAEFAVVEKDTEKQDFPFELFGILFLIIVILALIIVIIKPVREY